MPNKNQLKPHHLTLGFHEKGAPEGSDWFAFLELNLAYIFIHV